MIGEEERLGERSSVRSLLLIGALFLSYYPFYWLTYFVMALGYPLGRGLLLIATPIWVVDLFLLFTLCGLWMAWADGNERAIMRQLERSHKGLCLLGILFIPFFIGAFLYG